MGVAASPANDAKLGTASGERARSPDASDVSRQRLLTGEPPSRQMDRHRTRGKGADGWMSGCERSEARSAGGSS